jgi:RND family efflux transporter MFP subunit
VQPVGAARCFGPALLLLPLLLAAAHARAATPAAPAPSVATLRPAAVTLPATAPAPTAPAPAVAARPAVLGCLIEASAIVEIGSSVIGVLTAIDVERGDVIKKGQVLARLDGSVERAAVKLAETKVNNQADIVSARSQKNYATRKAVRTAELTNLQFVSAQAREQADTEASMAGMKLAQTLEQQTVAQQELAMARAQLAQRTVRSPLDGVVVDRYTSVGERIENRPILKIAQIDPLRVEVVLPSSLFNVVKAGMKAHVLPELQGTRPQLATVAIVDRVIDASSNTFRVRLTLPNRDLDLPSGVRCKVEFDQ